jgi:SAM-dependent methyltransferase
MAETSKAHARREREGFFEKYCQGKGIDIGCGDDPIRSLLCDKWDKEQGDATFMSSALNSSYNFVYSSHAIEHLDFPHIAIVNWVRILKPGGHLIVFVPHREKYERRQTLPSRFNGDHRTFWLPDRDEPPCTLGLIPLVAKWGRNQLEFIYCKVCDDGWAPCPPEQHAGGEYSIEGVWKKL